MHALLGISVLVFISAAIYPQQVDTHEPASMPGEAQTPKRTLTDWSDLSRYKQENDALAPVKQGEKRVVFLGSSTTDNWGRKFDSVFFPGKSYINRGISGETTSQMLLRFQQDAVELKPAIVVFLGGNNDVAGNSGPMTLETTEANIRSMVAIAQGSGIKIILASQLPVTQFYWNKNLHPEPELLKLSGWEKEFAATHHLAYIDYYKALVGADGSYRPGLSVDGVHPNKKAYELMAPLAESAIEGVLNTR